MRSRNPGAIAQEISIEFAKALYEDASYGGRLRILNAAESQAKGSLCTGLHYIVWGEDITDKILFERILKGELQSGIRGF